MSNRLLILPLLDGMIPDGILPESTGSCTYPVIHEASGVKLFVKRISVPEATQSTDALLLAGVIEDRSHVSEYYLNIINNYRKELAVFSQLSKSDYICGFLRYQVAEREDMAGYDLYLLSRRRETLPEYLKAHDLTKKQAAALGIDLCRALLALREAGYVHQHLKPGDIFVEGGHFCIGDLGLAAIEGLENCTLPSRSMSIYTPPELCVSTGKLNATIDIYAVGMILYTIYNGGHLPFEDSETSAYQADRRRLHGEDLPAAVYADYEMDAIIRKACAYHPEDRYRDPSELLDALTGYMESRAPDDTPVVPPLVTDVPISEQEPPEIDWEAFLEDDEIPEEALPEEMDEVPELSEDFKKTFAPKNHLDMPKKKGFAGLVILLLLFAMILAAAGGAYYYFYYSAVTVDNISITDRGTDFLTVSVSSNNTDVLMVTCSNEDGSYSKTVWGSASQTFTGLNSSSLYTITVAPLDWHYLKGLQTLSAATNGYTEVSAFHVTDNDDGTATVTIQVSGPDPDAWTLMVSPENEAPVTYQLVGHTCTITDLMPNITYRLAIDPGPGYFVSGELNTSIYRDIVIIGSGVSAEYDGSSRIYVSWESDSQYPTEWTVTCSGSNGYTTTITTEDSFYSFDGISANAEYSIAITNPHMQIPLITSLHISAGNLTEISAVEEGGKAHIAWDFDNDSLSLHWIVTLTADTFDYTASVTTETPEADFEDLLPLAGYTVTITTEENAMIDGENTCSFKTKDVEKYSEHSLGSLYTVLYRWPKENWTLANLSSAGHNHSKNGHVIFCVALNTTPKERDEEEVSVLLVMRNSDGEPVTYNAYDTNWSDLWDGKIFAQEIDTPSVTGDYTIDLYFNRGYVVRQSLTVID